MHFGFMQLSHTAERDKDVLFYVSQYNKQNRQCTHICNIKARSRSHCCHWKVSHILSVHL